MRMRPVAGHVAPVGHAPVPRTTESNIGSCNVGTPHVIRNWYQRRRLSIVGEEGRLKEANMTQMRSKIIQHGGLGIASSRSIECQSSNMTSCISCKAVRVMRCGCARVYKDDRSMVH
jgi:hypothetical protein